jgi:hypothetical protein
MKLFRAILLGALFLVGCKTGPVGKFYSPTAATADLEFKSISNSKVKIFRGDASSLSRWIREGYKLIGTSDYSGEYPDEDYMRRQAKKVGASIVVFEANYLETERGAQRIVLPNPNQTITSQTYGNVGPYGYQERTTTTIPGGYSAYNVPYAFTRYDIHIGFLGKPKL